VTSLGSLHQAVDGSYIASISFQLDSIINPAASFFNVSLIARKKKQNDAHNLVLLKCEK
jgi:hypothetical protein